MIGTILFFLVSAHLAVGMTATLLVVSPRAVGERFFRFSATAALSLLALAEVVYAVYGSHPGAGARVLELRRSIDAAHGWLWASALAAAAYVTTLPLARRALNRTLLAASAALGIAFLGSVARGFASPAIPQRFGFVIFPLDFFLSALALGSVVVCMILGHWYLVEPGMSVRPLKRVAALLIGVIAGRIVTGACTSLVIWSTLGDEVLERLAGGGGIDLLFLAQRVVFGLALPMALSWMIWETVKIRSTQSATGILYVAVVFVLFGEFLSHYLLVATGYPL